MRTVSFSPRLAPKVLMQPVGQAASITYQYDSLDRLTRADYPNGVFLQYGYDAIGNQLSE